MSNYWLDLCECEEERRWLSNNQLEELVSNWQHEKSSTRHSQNYLERTVKLRDAFDFLVSKCLEIFDERMQLQKIPQIKQVCMARCFRKAIDFDNQKGKAFNYFTTVILGKMREKHSQWKS